MLLAEAFHMAARKANLFFWNLQKDDADISWKLDKTVQNKHGP